MLRRIFETGLDCPIFTELAPRSIQSTIRNVRLFVCAITETQFQVSWRALVEGRIATIFLPSHHFSFLYVSMIFCVSIFFWVFGPLETSLLCIMGELAEGGSVAVAVGVSERCHAIGNL